ncbi:pyruvate kinase alpha/beta domain-containing protein [Chloroflexota bacterium]
MEGKIIYFDKPGTENTEEVLHIAKARAEELGIKSIVVATTIGSTAVKAAELFEGMKVVVVTHVTGMMEANVQEFTEENRQKVENNGGLILTTTHAFSGLSGAMRKKFKMYLIGDIVASTLRLLGQGMKVVCEIAVMAADAGLVRTDEDIIAIAGTGRGADTAVVLTPVNSNDFFDLKVKEILCKPHF